MNKASRVAYTALAATIIYPSTNSQSLFWPDYFIETVATGISLPTAMTFIGHNDFLICEKNSGRVRRYTNGSFAGIVIDLAVANNSERGLLGITTHPNFPKTPLIYLYYSRSTVDGGTWLDNRVERFVWNGSILTFDSTIIVFPFDAAQANGPNHDGGYMRFGPDGKLYIQTGDLNRGRFNNSRIEQNTSPTFIAGVGGVHRLNSDGTIPNDNPFFYHPDSRIRGLFAYGHRNGYGMDFDPLTNWLWLTENGPNVYDEVNLCLPGFNSGWLKIMGPDSRDASYIENNFMVFNAGDLVYLDNSHYRDPEFSWLEPVGITGIRFLTSRKFLPEHRNNVIIGDFNNGALYYYQMNATRDGFVLFGGTLDKVADNDTERNQHRIGTGFGGVTDILLGPDGYVYIAGWASGSVYRIRPKVEPLDPTGFSVTQGSLRSGGLDELLDSDDLRLIVEEAPVASFSAPSVSIVVNATSPSASPISLLFKYEGSVTALPAEAINQRISLYNHTTGQWDILDTRPATFQDSVVTIEITTKPSNYINPNSKEISARIDWLDLGIAFFPAWLIAADQTTFSVRLE